MIHNPVLRGFEPGPVILRVGEDLVLSHEVRPGAAARLDGEGVHADFGCATYEGLPG